MLFRFFLFPCLPFPLSIACHSTPINECRYWFTWVPISAFPSPSITLGRVRGPYICFCETNPPFFDRVFDVTIFTQLRCERNLRANSVGSFWKTNPPGGVF